MMNEVYGLPAGADKRNCENWVKLPPWEWPEFHEQEAKDDLVELGWCDACHKRTYVPHFLKELVTKEPGTWRSIYDVRPYLAWCPWCHRIISYEMDNEGEYGYRFFGTKKYSFLGYAMWLTTNAVLMVTSWMVASHHWTVTSKSSIDRRMAEAREILAWYWKIKGM